MNQKKVVITGGAGFIGSNLADELISNNQVTIIDDLTTGTLNNIAKIIANQKVKVVSESILNLQMLKNIFTGVDVVFHEAAITSVVQSVRDPVLTNEVNIKGTLNVLIAARDNKVKKVVFASSAAVYGDGNTIPINENMITNLQSPYALTKLTGEYYCRLFNDLYGLPTVCLRYFNVYGPRQNPNSEYSSVIPSFISRVLNDCSPIIYGDGNQTRDFVFIKDVIQANIIAAESNATGVFNVGSGNTTTINNLAQKIITILGRKLKPLYKEARVGEVRNSLADLSLVNSIGYTPKYTLEGGLSETIESIMISK